MPLPDFLLIPGKIISDESLQPLDGLVYGIVYWYSRQKLEKCFATSKHIAEILNSTEGGVQNAINRLIKSGFLESIYHRVSHERELIPLLILTKSTTSNNAVAPHQTMGGSTSNDVVDNIIRLSNNTTPIVPKGTVDNSDKKEDNEQSAPKALALTEEFITKFNTAFKSDHRVTKARTDKLKLRLKTYKFEEILKALVNLSRSNWHRGDNDRGWRADPDFLLRSDEQIDKWLQGGPKKMSMSESAGYHDAREWMKSPEGKAWGY